jgi:predicted transcriptional regulator of viral defense system
MHDIDSSQPRLECLFDIASTQWGYFTSAQARDCGLSWALLSYHTRSTRFIRVRHGVYRLRDYPSMPREELVAAWLAAGKDTAVVSHESALELLNLSDVVPAAVHLTVPREKRYLSRLPDTIVHTTVEPLTRRDTVVREGVRLTSPARSIVDAAEWGTAPEQIIMAVQQAIDRLMTTPERLEEAVKGHSHRVRELVEIGIETART